MRDLLEKLRLMLDEVLMVDCGMLQRRTLRGLKALVEKTWTEYRLADAPERPLPGECDWAEHDWGNWPCAMDSRHVDRFRRFRDDLRRPSGLEVDEATAKLIEMAKDKIAEMVPKRRGWYQRDHLFLEWYEDADSNTHRSPAKIRNKWNGLGFEERKQLAPESPDDVLAGKVSADTAKKGVKAAGKERRN